MTIFPTAAGSLLCLSPQDLPAGQPLTDDTLLPLVRRALIQNGQALPLHPELEVFPSREQVLVFIRPRPLPAGPEQKPMYKLC